MSDLSTSSTVSEVSSNSVPAEAEAPPSPVVGATMRTSSGTKLGLRRAALRDIATQLGVTVELTPEERKQRSVEARSASDELVEGLAALSSLEGGKLLGIGFDPDKARTSIAHLAAAQSFANDARHLGWVVLDTALTERAEVAKQAMSVLRALEAYAETPEGARLRAKARELRAAARVGRPRKPRKKEVPIVKPQ